MIQESGKPNHQVVKSPDNARAEALPPLAPLKLQNDVSPGDAASYSLDELLCYHDRAFVEHIYAALLKRNPTIAEREHSLEELRSGRLNKVEMIEALLDSRTDGEPTVQVKGLPSRAVRRLTRLPVLGYALRVFRGLVRLPVIMRDQQRFEAYALAQQQRMVDYLNEQLVPALKNEQLVPALKRPHLLDLDDEKPANLTDVVESVLMLSESLVKESERQSVLEERLERIEEQLGLLQSNQQELHAGLLDIQQQREKSETKLHADAVALTEALKVQQQEMERLRNESNENAAAQREFLIQEQRLIVEAQKVAFKELEEDLSEIDRNQAKRIEELAIIVHHLQQTIAPGSTSAPRHSTAEEVDES